MTSSTYLHNRTYILPMCVLGTMVHICWEFPRTTQWEFMDSVRPNALRKLKKRNILGQAKSKIDLHSVPSTSILHLCRPPTLSLLENLLVVLYNIPPPTSEILVFHPSSTNRSILISEFPLQHGCIAQHIQILQGKLTFLKLSCTLHLPYFWMLLTRIYRSYNGPIELFDAFVITCRKISKRIYHKHPISAIIICPHKIIP